MASKRTPMGVFSSSLNRVIISRKLMKFDFFEIWSFSWFWPIFYVFWPIFTYLLNLTNYVGKCRFLILHQLYQFSTVEEKFGRSLDAVGNAFVKLLFSQYLDNICWPMLTLYMLLMTILYRWKYSNFMFFS